MSLNLRPDNDLQPQSLETDDVVQLAAHYSPKRVIEYIEGSGIHPGETIMGDMFAGSGTENNRPSRFEIINKNAVASTFAMEVTRLEREIRELEMYLKSKEGLAPEHASFLGKVIVAKRAEIERLRDSDISSNRNFHNDSGNLGRIPNPSQFALSEGFRRLIAMGLQEANPNIIPYELRVDPPHRHLIIPKLDMLHQVSPRK